MTSIEFEVTGRPPIKNEAKSLSAAGHAHRDRVEHLLRGATAAETGWTRVNVPTDIALDVVVRSPTPRPLADATNFLDGAVGEFHAPVTFHQEAPVPGLRRDRSRPCFVRVGAIG